MTRKDYQLIASVLKNYQADGGVVIERDEIAIELAKALATDNPRFDRDRFLVAAGYYKACTHLLCTNRVRFVTGQGEWCETHLPEWAKKIKSEVSAIN